MIFVMHPVFTVSYHILLSLVSVSISEQSSSPEPRLVSDRRNMRSWKVSVSRCYLFWFHPRGILPLTWPALFFWCISAGFPLALLLQGWSSSFSPVCVVVDVLFLHRVSIFPAVLLIFIRFFFPLSFKVPMVKKKTQLSADLEGWTYSHASEITHGACLSILWVWMLLGAPGHRFYFIYDVTIRSALIDECVIRYVLECKHEQKCDAEFALWYSQYSNRLPF